MSLLDKFKNKNEQKKGKGDQANVLDMVQEDGATKTPTVLKENTGHAHRVLKNYHLSEKSNMLSSASRYVFRVSTSANKIEVKKAIEKVYDVHVVKVNILNILGKSRRQGRTKGRTQDWKKAIVTLKTGERISGLAEGV